MLGGDIFLLMSYTRWRVTVDNRPTPHGQDPHQEFVMQGSARNVKPAARAGDKGTTGTVHHHGLAVALAAASKGAVEERMADRRCCLD